MTEPAPSATIPDPARFLTTFVTQLERERRAFLWRNAAYVAANLVLAGLVWSRPGGGPAAWAPAAIAFLANVFHALTTEWEHRWEAVWRRELPRLESRFGAQALVGEILRDPAQARLRLWLKWTSWALTVAWLVGLLLVIGASGLDFGIAP